MKLCLTLPLFAVAVALSGCIASTPADDTDESFGDDEGAQKAECAGPFNCKLPNQGAHNANRADDPQNGTDHWPIKAGTTLHDGFGNVRGTVTDHSVMINYGQRKIIGGLHYVYAFAVALDDGTHASGWIRSTAVKDDIASMPTVSDKDPGHGDYQTVFTVTGGDPNAFGDLKVDPNFTGEHEAASDYLTRPGNVFNLLYNLPGVGGVTTDTLPIGAHFHRSLDVKAVEIALYHPGGAKVAGHMMFVYGHVGSRYGWIAHEALSK